LKALDGIQQYRKHESLLRQSWASFINGEKVRFRQGMDRFERSVHIQYDSD